jgi:hypothetical protein
MVSFLSESTSFSSRFSRSAGVLSLIYKRITRWRALVLTVPFPLSVVSEAQGKIVVVMRLQLDVMTARGLMVDFGKDETGRVRPEIGQPGRSRFGIAPGGVRILAEHVRKPERAYSLRVDADGDGDVAHE